MINRFYKEALKDKINPRYIDKRNAYVEYYSILNAERNDIEINLINGTATDIEITRLDELKEMLKVAEWWKD